MSDNSSTTAAKASGVTPTTALPYSNNSEKSTHKSNLPASNPNPLPESPTATSESAYPAAAPASRPPAPTAGVTANMVPTDRLASLDDDTTPTKTIPLTQSSNNNPPAPQAGSVPHPFTSTQSTSKDPSEPRPGATPSAMAESTAPIATMTSMPAPSFTMPPPVQTTYGPPEVTLRGQPLHGTTGATATSTEYNNYPSAIRRGSDVAPTPGGYQQRDNLDRPLNMEEDGKREPGLLGKIGQAVDKVNEWVVGDKGSAV